jgi:hypothetical protein
MTGFEEIYELSTIIMEDEKVKQAPIYKKYLILYKFLQFAIGHFNTRCFKDLKTIRPFEYKEYNILGDGIETEYQLSEELSPDDMDIYVEIETESGSGVFIPMNPTDFSFDKVTSTITFVNPINNKFRCNIYTYVIGYFYDDLDVEEKVILAKEMGIPFLESQLKKESLTNQMIYGTGAKMYSQAEHMKQINNILKNERYEIEGLINAYTYESDPELVLVKNKNQKEITKTYDLTNRG